MREDTPLRVSRRTEDTPKIHRRFTYAGSAPKRCIFIRRYTGSRSKRCIFTERVHSEDTRKRERQLLMELDGLGPPFEGSNGVWFRAGVWKGKPVALRMSSASSTGFENVIVARRQQEAQQPLLRQVQAGRREVSAPPARLEQRDSRGGGRQAGLLPRVRVGAAAACSSQASPPPRGALLSPHPSWLRSVLLPWAVGYGGRAGGQGGAQAGQAAAEAAAHARAGAASTVSSHGSRRAVCAGSPSPHGLPPPPLGASHPCGPCG